MNHRESVLKLLKAQIRNDDEVKEIEETGEKVAQQWVDPLSGGAAQSNGLIYGLVQSGKTGVIAVTGAIAADRGYKTLIILTSDIDPLYLQTLNRMREAFPGMDVIGKDDFQDTASFLRRVRGSTCAVVTTKNASRLDCLIENFKRGNLKGASCLLIDDEADQASLNTRASKDDGSQSAINEKITILRNFFEKNTYLHVTATPQALFLQASGHDFRPKFTVLSHPGVKYIGGRDFFGERSQLVENFNLEDLATLAGGSQPAPGRGMPRSLERALDTFMIAATYKRQMDVTQNCAFLCHVSTRKADHAHIVSVLRDYKLDLREALEKGSPAVLARLRAAYDGLCATEPALVEVAFDELIGQITFYAAGINVKLVNGETDEDVAVSSPYNLFVGGNKLGRGVTIKNLLVSYYGRNPRSPQADTVLQHARMYGYRRDDRGLLRLFLPRELQVVFSAITQMENELRALIEGHPEEDFRGVYVENQLSPTRKNILAPGAVGLYAGGSSYNPAQIINEVAIAERTAEIDAVVAHVANKAFATFTLSALADLVRLTSELPDAGEGVWDKEAIAESLLACQRVMNSDAGYIYVDRDRGLVAHRRETQGVLDGGEAERVPADLPTLFLLRVKPQHGGVGAWWPQVRLPRGKYAFAFAL